MAEHDQPEESGAVADDQRSARRDWILFVVVWLILTVVMWLAYAAVDVFPEQYAREARVVDEAFNLLVFLGIPVFAFVLAMLVVSAVRFRSPGAGEDGPPITGTRRVIVVWLVITGALALTVLINPGFVGLADVRGDPDADIIIDVTAQRWSWTITYPNGAQTSSFDSPLVLPVDTRVRFDVTAPEADVVHSFWVPAFRVKIDAVPGRTTQLLVTPVKVGSTQDDPTLRLQCAELCGIGHAGMSMDIEVVERSDFDAYIAALKEGG